MGKSPVYTRTGDKGTTALADGSRRVKHDARLEAYGTVDELNSWLGMLRADIAAPDDSAAGSSSDDATGRDALLSREFFDGVQSRLFDIGGWLATPGATSAGIDAAHVEALEQALDRIDGSLPRLRCFVLPSGTAPAARAQVARTVCRRAERRITALSEAEPGFTPDPTAMAFINRLSDLLFVYARALNHAAGVADIPWIPRKS